MENIQSRYHQIKLGNHQFNAEKYESTNLEEDWRGERRLKR